MKNFFLFLTLTLLVCSCGQPTYQQPQYQTIPQPNGQQVVVVQDHDGTEFFMEMLMFQALMSNGGMGNVQGYYHQNRYAPEFQSQQTTYRTTVNNYYNDNPTKRPEYKPSNGFGNSNSNGSATQTSQPKVQYNPSNGFSQPTTTSPTPQPSKGFGTSKYVAPDVKTSTPPPSYKPSSGFGSSSGSSSTYKPSSGFGSKGSTTTSSSSSYKSSSGFKKKN